MSVKGRRHELIRRVITGQPIVSQEVLVSELVSRGENVTQATVSRDLKEMGVLKGPEGYRLASAGASSSMTRPSFTHACQRLREYSGYRRASAASSLRPAQAAGMAVTAGL